jgi:hypothetical protein
MASDFLQGFQVGANLFAQAKQLQEARQRSMMQAQEMIQNIRAAQSMQQYRDEQLKVAKAEEYRKTQEWNQQQQIEKERQQFLSDMPQMRQKMSDRYNLIPEQMRPQSDEIDETIGRDYIMKFGTPSAVGSYLGQQEATRRYEAGIQSREGLAREATDARLELEKYKRGEMEEQYKANREMKLKIAKMQIEGRPTKRTPHQQTLVDAALTEYKSVLSMIPPTPKYQPQIDEAEATFMRKVEEIDNAKDGGTVGSGGVVGRFTADGKFIPAK